MTLSSRLLPHQHPRQLRGCAPRNWPHRGIVFHRSISAMCDYVLTWLCVVPTESSMENLSFTHSRLPYSHPLDLEAALRGQRSFVFLFLVVYAIAGFWCQFWFLVLNHLQRHISTHPFHLLSASSRQEARHAPPISKVSRMKMLLLNASKWRAWDCPTWTGKEEWSRKGAAKKVPQTLHCLCLWLPCAYGYTQEKDAKGIQLSILSSGYIRMHQALFDLSGHAPCHTICWESQS